MKRISLDEWVAEGDGLILIGETGHRARNVLRVRKGESIIGTDGRGTEYVLNVTAVLPDRIEVQIVGQVRNIGESPLRVTLAQVVPRFSRMDFVVQKATELGVDRIVPLVSERSVARPESVSTGGKVDRWDKIASQAVAQCRRTVKPVISGPVSLDEFLSEKRAQISLLLHYGTETAGLSKLEVTKPDSVEIVSGPEGGFSGEEMAKCKNAGFVAVSLGPRVLRAETAGLVALAIVQHRWGDIG